VRSPRPGVPGSQPQRRPALGLFLLGVGRPQGLDQFGADADSYLNSLAPLLGMLIVIALLFALEAGALRGGLFFLIVFCNLLAPPVIGHGFARWWKRLDRWPLYANVLNWSWWLMVCLVALLLPLSRISLSTGVSPMAAALLMLGVLTVYEAWFHWFIARHALQLSRLRALLVMLCVVFGTGVLLQVPIWIGEATGLQPAPEFSVELPNGSGS
jgi:hypothetical protein